MVKASNENEQVYLNFFETLSSGDLEKIRATFHDEAVWQVQVKGILGEGSHRGKKAIVDEFLAPVRGMDKEQGARTRRAFVERYADRKVMIIGTHFCDPTSGWIVRDGDAWKLALK